MKSHIDAIMQAKNLDALLVFGHGEHNPPMYYFTGGGHVSNAVLIKKRGEPAVLYCNAMEREEAAKSGLKIIPISTSPMEELAKSPAAMFAPKTTHTNTTMDRLSDFIVPSPRGLLPVSCSATLWRSTITRR